MTQLIDIEKVRMITQENSIKVAMNKLYAVIDKDSSLGMYMLSIGTNRIRDLVNIETKLIVEELKKEGFKVEVAEGQMDGEDSLIIMWNIAMTDPKSKAYEFYKQAITAETRNVEKMIANINEAIMNAAQNGNRMCRVPLEKHMLDVQVQLLLEKLANAGYLYESQRLPTPFGRRFDIVIKW